MCVYKNKCLLTSSNSIIQLSRDRPHETLATSAGERRKTDKKESNEEACQYLATAHTHTHTESRRVAARGLLLKFIRIIRACQFCARAGPRELTVKQTHIYFPSLSFSVEVVVRIGYQRYTSLVHILYYLCRGFSANGVFIYLCAQLASSSTLKEGENRRCFV